jgi:predicted  nucleic acid-binding Zn-ribbon protein
LTEKKAVHLFSEHLRIFTSLLILFFSAAKALSEDATIVPRLNDRLKEYEEKFHKLGEDLKDEKEKVRKAEQEITDLRAKLKAKVKEDSNKVTEVAVTSSNKL